MKTLLLLRFVLLEALLLCGALPELTGGNLHPEWREVCLAVAVRADLHPSGLVDAPLAVAVAWHESTLSWQRQPNRKGCVGPLQYTPRYFQGAWPDHDVVGPGLDALAHYERRYRAAAGARVHCHYRYGNRPPAECSGGQREAMSQALRARRERARRCGRRCEVP
jgi:hypothetical protein